VSAYSVVDAKNCLPKLIDQALVGEEMLITRHGKPVVELKPATGRTPNSSATYAWLRGQRDARPGVGLTSVQILDRMYESDTP
jgi:antitoxin (DNA-binding transcriptional repressor) of toxin-antitoxin stability system